MSEHRPSDPETWVDQYGDYLFRFALLRLKNPEAAEEVVQETFLSALKGRERFQGKASERTWMVGILKNKIFDHFRRSSREQQATEPAVDAALEQCFNDKGRWKELPASWSMNPADLFEKREFWKVFTECFDKLPDRLSRAFSMVEMDGLKSGEVCKVLDLTATNLWVMLHRVRVRLRNCLDSNWFNVKGSA
jgi:RNA polymerase sigma-70 factor (ECF subfamily)